MTVFSLYGAAPTAAQSAVPGPAAADSSPSAAPSAFATEPGPVLDAADFAGALTADADASPSETPAPRGSSSALSDQGAEVAEYDPWEPFNQKTFAFNHGLDRHVIKPVAKAYDKVVPNVVQRAVKNIFENIGSIRRIVNTALQGRFNDTGQELGRFVINTLFGLGGFVDAAPSFGVAPRMDADTGQTFGVWGAGPGPYLVLPLLPPLTARDAFGFVVDTALDPLTWVAPFEAGFPTGAEKAINERSMNLELYENVEETVLDLYTAVENAYLQSRNRAIEEGLARGPFGRRAHPKRPEE